MRELPIAIPGLFSPQAIFLDRDGTINRERADYVKSWQEYEWLPGALAALALLAHLDAPILIVSNQSAVGRGILKMDVLDAMHAQQPAGVSTTFLSVRTPPPSSVAVANHSLGCC
jgi:HAD superfamily hydrolase (TIGR01662 family)